MKKKKKILVLATILSSVFTGVMVSCSIQDEIPMQTPIVISDNNKLDDIKKMKPDLIIQDKTKINKKAEKVKFRVKNIKSFFASEIKKNMVEYDFDESSKYNINIKKIEENSDKKSIIIVYDISEKIENLTSDLKVYILNGFKPIPISVEKLNEKNNDVILTIQNIDNFSIDSIGANNIIINGVNKEKFDVRITRFEKNDIDNTLIVFYNIKEKNGVLTSDEKSVVFRGFKRQKITTSRLNIIADGIKLDYSLKNEILVSEANLSDVIIPNLYQSGTQIILKNFKVSKDEKSINVTFVIGDLLYPNNQSDEKNITIKGFKVRPLSEEQMNIENSKLMLNYRNANQTLIDDFNINNVSKLGYDSSKVLVNLNDFKISSDKTSVIIDYSLIDINNSTNILIKQTKTISGFKIPELSKSELELNANKIELMYPDKENTLVDNAIISDISFNNFDESKVKISEISINKNNSNKTNAIIRFKVFDVNYPSNFILKTIDLNGFKHPPTLTVTLDAFSNKVNFDYPQKENIFVKDIQKSLISSELISVDFGSIEITNFTVNKDKTSITIFYTLNDLYSENKSSVKTKILSGFKPLPLSIKNIKEIGSKISFEYNDKQNVLARNSNLDLFVNPTNISNALVTVNNKTLGDNNTSVIVNFSVTDINYPENTLTFNYIVEGFKIPELNSDKLRELANLITPNYSNKTISLIFDITRENFSFENVSDKVIASVESWDAVSESQVDIDLMFNVVDVNYPTNKIKITKRIVGFKHPPISVANLNNQAKSINFEYPQKEFVLVKNAKKNLISFSDYNTELTQVSVIKVVPNSNDSLTVNYTLNDLNSENTSEIHSKIISGFRPEQLTTLRLEELAKQIDFNILDKENILASSVTKENISISGNDNNFTNSEILSVSLGSNNQSVLIKFIIKDKNYLANTFTFSKQIDGFKIPQLTTEQLNLFAQDITLSYDNLSNTLVSNFNHSNLSFLNIPTQVNATYLSSSIIEDETQSINIKFEVVDKNYSSAKVSITKKISGFKHPPISVQTLNMISESISLDYPQKNAIFVEEFDKNLIISSGNNNILTKVSIDDVSIVNNSLNVSYRVGDLNSTNVSVSKTKNINGFKIPQLTTAELKMLAKSVSFEYPTKETILSSAATLSSITRNTTAVNGNLVEITSIVPNDESRNLTVNFIIKDANYISNTFSSSYIINGFKIPMLSNEELITFGNGVVVDYRNKSTTRLSAFNRNNLNYITFSNKFRVSFLSFSLITSEQNSVNVTFEAIDVNYPTHKVQITKKVEGFKPPADTKIFLDKVLANSTLIGFNTSSVDVDNATNNNFKLIDINADKYELIIEEKTPLEDRRSMSVRYSIKEKGESLKSDTKTVVIDGFKLTPETIKPFVRPAGFFATSQPVSNPRYDVSTDSSLPLFEFNSEGSNSYRIPNPIKLRNGEVLVSADKRVKGKADYGQGAIDQVIKRSKDNGKTFEKNELVVKISTPKTNDGLTIDGTISEVLIDKNDPSKGTKLLYLFDVFTGYNGINLIGNNIPFRKIKNEVFWKFWIKNGTTGQDLPDSYFLRRVPENPYWWRVWQTPDGKNRDTFSEADLPNLIPLKIYVDFSYDKNTRIISGQVYENVEETDLKNPTKLKTKASVHSVFEDYRARTTKYVFASNNYNFLLESYDNGKTWENLIITDTWRHKPGDLQRFLGNGVGNGIQLKNQSNELLNGRIIFPVYTFTNGRQRTSYIFSDDNGKTWENFNPGFNNETSESTMVELPDGKLIWTIRNAQGNRRGKTWVSQSVDGGLTWQNPKNPSQKLLLLENTRFNASLFNGLTYFELQGEIHYVFSAPETIDGTRKNGALFITKDWVNFDKVWQFDTRGVQDFTYSYPVVLEVGANYADILLTYEWSEKSWLDSRASGKEQGAGITATRFRIIKK